MSGEIKIAGLSSGIPFDELITQMLEAEKYQAKKLEDWRKTWENKIDALRDLSSRVSSLQTVNDSLRIATSFISRLASTTNSSVADITVDSNAQTGNIQLEVSGPIQHIVGSRGFSGDADEIAGIDDTLTFRVGNFSSAINVEIFADMSWNDIVAEINSQSDGKVSASIETQANGFSRIVLSSNVAGQSGRIIFDNDINELSFSQSSFDQNFTTTDIDDNIVNYDYLEVTGNYFGHNAKTVNFTVENGWSDVNPDAAVIINWVASDGTSGSLEFTQDDTEVELFQGIKINISDIEEIETGHQFSLNLYNSELQIGQDKGLAQSAQIESKHKWSSNSAIIANQDGVFSYTYAGETHELLIPEGTTLDRLVWMINESSENPGVRASILNDGQGGFSLLLTGFDSGVENQLKINNVTDSVLTSNDFNTNRQATNAIFRLDGSPNWIHRSTNLVTDIDTGVSIRLKDVGVTSFSITTDHDDMADKVQAFVDEYNAILEYIDEITKVVLDEEGDANMHAAGVLVGNYAVNMLRSALRAFIGSRAEGFNSDTDTYSLLTQIGLNSNHVTKRLEFDRDEFKAQLNSNERDVVRLFAADSETSLNTRGFSIEPAILGLSNYQSGNYDFNVDYNADGTLSHVSMFDPSTGETYTSDDFLTQRQIRIAEDGKSFSIHVGGLRNMIINNVQLSASSQVDMFTLTVKDGKAKSFDNEINKLFDETTGITKVLEKNYESIIKNIDKRIEREYMRVLQVKKRLELRFARLEVNMGNWNGQMERLQQQMRQLPSSM